jgi:hypothetical protein
MIVEQPLGRREPTTWEHVDRYPLRMVQPGTVSSVERKLDINSNWRVFYDQGNEGACVGFSSSLMMSILNRTAYDAHWLYTKAQLADEWPETPPEEGTSVRAGMDVLRLVGHRRRLLSGTNGSGVSYVPDLQHGILENRWATSVDQIRTCIANGTPAVLGCNWYADFDDPEVVTRWLGLRRSEYWIGKDRFWGRLRGGHAICVYGASDKREAFALCNSWGIDRYDSRGDLVSGYPLVWLPYEGPGGGMQRLINENGELTIVTDRPDVPKGDQ